MWNRNAGSTGKVSRLNKTGVNNSACVLLLSKSLYTAMIRELPRMRIMYKYV